jgi:hypothetical protein
MLGMCTFAGPPATMIRRMPFCRPVRVDPKRVERAIMSPTRKKGPVHCQEVCSVFAATHMAVGAVIESRVRGKAPTALIALASAAVLDMTIFWDSRAAEYDWPRGSFAWFHVVPYPHDGRSWLLVAVLIVSAVAVVLVLGLKGRAAQNRAL